MKQKAEKSAPRAKLEPADARRDRALEILKRLKKLHPDAGCTLDFKNPFELLVATILAAQCTDEMVNRVTPELFAKYPDPKALAAAKLPAIEKLIKPTGFFRNKAKSITRCAAALVERHGGKVPGSMNELNKLPGVGRKTANVVLGEAFGHPAIIVDTHFRRVTARLALHADTDPDKIEAAICSFFPEKHRTRFSDCILFHGRRVCSSRKPKCFDCRIEDLCPYPEKTEG